MSFQPSIPVGGLAGWQFLKRTQESQQQAFEKSADVQKQLTYFENRIGSVKSSADLVGDYRLLNVALGAFGLSDDIGNKYYINKVLSADTGDRNSFVNRLSDTRYASLTKTFGFGDYQTSTAELSNIYDTVRTAYPSQDAKTQAEFGEAAARLINTLASRAERFDGTMSVDQIDALETEVDELWSQVMGSKSLREAISSAFQVPKGFDALAPSVQKEVLTQKISATFAGRSPDVVENFADQIKSAYLTRQFEEAVGEQSEELRLALNLERELPNIAGQKASEDVMWYRIMGNTPLRTVFERALNLPKAFGALDIDKQLSVFKQKAEAAFGSSDIAQFVDAEKREDLTRLFLVRTETAGLSTSYSPKSAALSLLSQASSGSLFSLLA